MKTRILLCLLIVFGTANAQFNESAPWVQQAKQNSSSANPTFKEVQQAFNVYWSTRDETVKGSGYKPFKRFEYIWEKEVNGEGELPTEKDKWDLWKQTRQNSSLARFTDQSNWLPIGPYTHSNTGSWSSGQARINVIAIDPNNSNTWYVGAPAGGLWKSSDAGSTWTPLTDDLPQIGVSGIAIDYSNSNIVYIATGDDDGGDTSSAGVFKSTDGGTTWVQTGLNPSNTPSSMNDIYINPSNSSMLWVATNGGVYKSTDSGATWNMTLGGNIKDIKLKPGNPNTVYAVTPNQFYKSTNAGDTFSQITNGVPTGGSRFVIDVTPADVDYVYLLSATSSNTFQGVYRSTNSGTSFSARNTSTDVLESTQSWFDLALGVSTTNANDVYVGCLNVWKSSNGGSSFSKLNNWSSPSSATYTHADIHQIRSFNGAIYVCSDGGIYSSTNAGGSFTSKTDGIQASQFYKVAVSPTNVNKMVGGLQDNGGHAYNNGNGNWLNYYGADGMDTCINPINDNKYYGFIQSGGALYKSSNSGSSGSGSVNAPGGASGNWVTPLIANSSGQIFAGYNRIYRLNSNENGWNTLANLGASADLIEVAPSNETHMFIAVDEVLKKSTDSGNSVTDIFTFGGNIKGIGIHTTNENIIWVTTSGGVFKSLDGGTTFNNITGNLPVSNSYLFFNDIVHQDGHSQNPVYLATSIGVYRIVDGGSWELFSNGLPTTIVTDLEVNVADNSLTAATYGRGVWRSSLPTCITTTANQEINLDAAGYQEGAAIDVCVGQNIALRSTVTTGASPTYVWSGPNGYAYTGQIATIDNISGAEFGDYIVTISTAGGCGDAQYTFTITGEDSIQPTSNDDAICTNDSTTLNASGSIDYRWYETATGGTEIATGSSFTTPALTASTTYYVAGTSAVIVSEQVNTVDISTAADYSFNQSLYFDANQDFTLESVQMNAMSTGNRTISVTDALGNIVATTTVNIPSGVSTVNLNLDVPKGNGLEIGITGALVDMRRTPTGNGVTYPIASPSGEVSITGNSADAPDYYYFFYDWNITTSGGRCESNRTPVTVTVSATNPDLTNATEINIDAAGYNAFSDGATLNVDEGASIDLRLPSTAFNGTWLWTAPNGTTYTTETVSFLNVVDGDTNVDGDWTVQATFTNDCDGTGPETISFTINVKSTLSVDSNTFEDFVAYPNPTSGLLTIKSSTTLSEVKMRIVDMQGRLLYDRFKPIHISPNQININLKELSVGAYFLIIEDESRKTIRQVIKY